MEWLFALAALLGFAVSGPHKGRKMNAEDLNRWPKSWGNCVPTADQIKAVEKAVMTFPKVPANLLFALEKRETNCTDVKGKAHGGNSNLYANSYARYANKVIPGSNITWRRMFPSITDWRPYGAWQLNPYHLVPKYVPAGAPLSEMLNPYKGAMAAADYLTRLYDEHGSWFDALIKYNANKGWREDVMKNYADLGGKLSDLGRPNV